MAYVLDLNDRFLTMLNKDSVVVERIGTRHWEAELKALVEEHARETGSAFAEEILRPAAHDADDNATYSPHLIGKAAELGITAINVPEEFDGIAATQSTVTTALVAEALANNLELRSYEAELAAAMGRGRMGWAILAGGTGSDQASIDRLNAAGWRAVVADPSGSVAPAWQTVGGRSR